MQIVGMQPRAVDGVFRAHVFLAGAGGCDGYILNRISKQLGRKTPDFAYMYRRVWRGIDLIYAPVISRPEIKAFGWSIAVGTLGYTTNAFVDIIEVLTQVNLVPINRWGENSRFPVKDHIS